MPRISDEHRQAQRERIKAATLRVFQEHGLGGASMNDVIKESGLSAGAIYGYFKNKEALVADVAAELVSGRIEIIDDLAALHPVPHPVDMVRRLIDTLPQEIATSGLVLEVWGAAAREGVVGAMARTQMHEITTSIARYLTAWFEQQGAAQPRERGEALAPVLAAVIQGYLVRLAIEGAPGGERYRQSLDALADLFGL